MFHFDDYTLIMAMFAMQIIGAAWLLLFTATHF